MIVDTLHVYWDTEEKYRWAFVSSNGKVIADSGQGYTDKRNALHGFAILNRQPVGPVPLYELQLCPRHDRTCQVWQIPRREAVA